MLKAALVFFIAFLITVVIGSPIIAYLRKLKFGQKILEIGPKWHISKQNTPTMGGIIFITAIVISVIIFGSSLAARGEYRHFIVLIFALGFGAIGFMDDYTKITKKRNLGLTPLQKLILQAAVSALFLTALRISGYISANLYIPFTNVSIPLSWYIYMPFAAFIIIGTVNSVNITDGLDGLATSVTLPVAVFFVFAAEIMQTNGIMYFAAAASGALLGFLIFNAYPAKVFMGDTGSLFLGGAVCGMAFACDMPLILVFVGIIYIIEALSDIIQVLYFKISHGKRIFKMAPIHHHFEMCGLNEKKIVTIFSTITFIMCFIAYFGIKGRYMP